MKHISCEDLKALVSYSSDTGEFLWIVDAGRYGRIKAGTIAGSKNKAHGYYAINIRGVLYPAHRLAWLYQYGEWPKGQIDHINGIRSDNRIANLRQATLQENMQNKKVYSSNTSGYPGVTWHARVKMWQARIGVDGERVHLGYWDDPKLAAEAYEKAKAVKHPFSPNVRGK